MKQALVSGLPQIIQGGMGVKISDWPLARAVSMRGQQGTISGVALERVLALLLQLGDKGDHIHRALAHFPFPDVAKKVLNAFCPKDKTKPVKIFRSTPVFSIKPSELLISLTICANFAFVWLAKEGHKYPISINYLEKLAMPHIYAITGAMLAGVDYITMGAGIPIQIPQVIQDLCVGHTAKYRVPVVGKNITEVTMRFSPLEFFGSSFSELAKPKFLPIISSNLLAKLFMTKLPLGSVDGFIIERPSAGGHNAPPRKLLFDEQGELIYGPKDQVNYTEIAEYGLPFWIGGSAGSPEQLRWALAQSANGIQVGTIFALCEESGMDPVLKNRLRQSAYDGQLQIKTGIRSSPTGFPFKVAQLSGTISDPTVYATRNRICDQGGLVSLYERPDGKIAYRCSAEPIEDYLRKGGSLDETVDRICLCNGLIATTSISTKANYEPALVTLGDDTSFVKYLMSKSDSSYTANDAIDYLLS